MQNIVFSMCSIMFLYQLLQFIILLSVVQELDSTEILKLACTFGIFWLDLFLGLKIFFISF